MIDFSIEDLKIEKGVKIKSETKSAWQALAEKMSHGDSVLVPRAKVANLGTAIKNTGAKAVSRKTTDGMVRVWKVER